MAPTLYRIRVRGHLRPEWSEWFEGMTISDDPDGNSTLSGLVADQAALHGLLLRVHDLGLVLMGVEVISTPAPASMRSDTRECSEA